MATNAGNGTPNGKNWQERIGEALRSGLRRDRVSRRPGKGGRDFEYLEIGDAFAQANEIFGWDGWSYEVVEQPALVRHERVDLKTGEVQGVELGYCVALRATMCSMSVSPRLAK